jgi:hypothetical protein
MMFLKCCQRSQKMQSWAYIVDMSLSLTQDVATGSGDRYVRQRSESDRSDFGCCISGSCRPHEDLCELHLEISRRFQ